MVYYDTDSRLQLAREHADRLADEMRCTRPLRPLEAEGSAVAKLGWALASRIERLRGRKAYRAPAYHA